MKYLYDLEIDDDTIIEVEFEATPRWENDGIGPYEYWGQKCFDAGTNYVSLEHYGSPTYDESKHTPEEVAQIDAWLLVEENAKDLEDYICNEYSNQEA